MDTLKDVIDLSWSFYCVLPVGENTIDRLNKNREEEEEEENEQH